MDKEQLKQTARRRKEEAKTNYETKLKAPYEFFLNNANGRITKASGAAGWRSTLFYPTTPNMIRSYVPRLVNGIIGTSGSDFFAMTPRKDVDSNGQSLRMSADVITAMQNAYMNKRGQFRQYFENTERNCCTYGVGYMIQTWQYEVEEWEYDIITKGGKDVKKGKGRRVTNEPLWYSPSTLNIWPDAGANTWQEMTYVVERRYARLSQIKVRAERERYSEKEAVLRLADAIKNSLETAAKEANNSGDMANTSGLDPVEETYTVYTRDTWVTLWRDEMIDCRPNPLAHHNIPVYAFVFEADPYTYQPKGIPAILSDTQQTQNVMMNLLIDNLNITVNTILVKTGTAFLDESQLSWEPGTVMTENMPNTLRKLDLGGTNPEGFKMLEMLAGLSNQSLSTQDFMSAPAGIASVNKTYGGLRLISQEANKQIAFVINSQIATGLIPMLQDLKCLCGQYISEEDASEVIGADKAKALNYDAKQKIAWDEEYDFIINGTLSTVDKQAKLEDLEQGVQMLGAIGYNLNRDLVAKQIIDSLDLDKAIILPPDAPGSVLQQQQPMGPANPNAVPNAANGGQPNVAPSAMPAQAPNAQSQAIQGIAQHLGVDPNVLLGDLQKGIIPGGLAQVIGLMRTPEGQAQLKKILSGKAA